MRSYLELLYGWVRGEIFAIPGRTIALIFFICLFGVPAFTQDSYYLQIIIFTTIYALFAASWDLLAGVTGQLNLGQALFFGVAAYAAAFLNIYIQLPPWATIPIGATIAVLVGLIAGMPALRLRGFYLALVSLSFPLILTGIIFMFPNVTGGELGLIGIKALTSSDVFNYYIIIFTFTISIFIIWKFTDTKAKMFRTGIILRAIREDEITARTSGINTTKYKLIAYAVSGFFAGIAGGLYVHFMKVAGPSTLDLFFSFQAILWTVFGGISTIYGAVTGAFILIPFVEILSSYSYFEDFRFIFLSLILIFTLLFMPEGITVWVLDKIELKCPRCKVINIFTRSQCRACRAGLRLEKKQTAGS